MGRFAFITMPRMGTKHVQDRLTRSLGVTDFVRGYETFVHAGREFRFGLGEYFRNYGFARGVLHNTYFRGERQYFDHERKYESGLPDGCYAHQIAYDDGWCFRKSSYINYYTIADSDFNQKCSLLSRYGKSFVIKVLFDQHSNDQLREIPRVADNVACFLKADLVSWICSCMLAGKYRHSLPRRVDPIAIDLAVAKRLINLVSAMIRYCRSERIPIIANHGSGVEIFGERIEQRVTREYSTFDYRAIVTNYSEIQDLVRSAGDVFSSYTPFLDVPPNLGCTVEFA